MDGFIKTYEQDIGPMNGAKVVAKAWTDPEYRQRLLDEGTAAVAELGFKGPQGEHIVVVENTDDVHNVVVCTLCSCYPKAILGMSPAWYKSAAYRARAVKDPRGVLREFGTDPVSGRPVVAKDGKFGVYVTDGETNASLSKGDRLEAMLPERAFELLVLRREAIIEKGGAPAKRLAKKATAKKAAAPKAPAKKAPAKKAAAKKAPAKKAAARKQA